MKRKKGGVAKKPPFLLRIMDLDTFNKHPPLS